LKFRNNVLVNSDGPPEDLYYYNSQNAYNSVTGDSVGVLLAVVMDEPELYGGYKVPVKGWNGDEFDNESVQAAYIAFLDAGGLPAEEDVEDETRTEAITMFQATYLAVYYPDIPRISDDIDFPVEPAKDDGGV
jgi:hypothetical protein